MEIYVILIALNSLRESEVIGNNFKISYSEKPKFATILISDNNSKTMDRHQFWQAFNEEFGEQMEAFQCDETCSKAEIVILL